MSVETAVKHEAVAKPEYTHKSFELVFAKFCGQYQRRVEETAGPQARRQDRFLGLPANASVQEMGQKLSEVITAVDEPAQLDSTYGDEVPLKEVLILSARNLAWSSVMTGLTSTHLGRLNDYIERERYSDRSNIRRLFNEKKENVSRQVTYNHAIRGYFDGRLANILGNASPEEMNNLLEHVSYLSDRQREGLVKGLSLEIASKRKLDELSADRYKVAYGSRAEDEIGGDLVISGNNDLVFIDLKSKMPEKFSDGTVSTELDYERGYRWLKGVGPGRQAVVWAYSNDPYRQDGFWLTDERLAASLEAVAMSVTIAK